MTPTTDPHRTIAVLAEMQEMERKRIAEAMLAALGTDLKAQPELVAEVFEEVTREVANKEAQVVWLQGSREEF
ncbi:hypothetical protein [Ralstonia pseudosolanacearum]|uniref:hypothetical protein n=1 Tax=Ralstonia pseudosolanacearum TaxID=1310165 RepID=UPI00048BDD9B|nr:hypothetical protein [Ralstonia pseudosolanacearum]MDO3576653.1 hypothetical protein [Ralstonia pseudosolanacearum]MDO3588973.1 hypothetical protein [Ralstonia pseudosolanacearum]